MFQVNTYRWDFAQVAALVAPRPLLILNTDRDGIFPIDGVTRLHAKVARIYELHGKPQNLGLAITPGGHSDSQELRIPAFNWFNKHLKGDTGPITTLASKEFTPRQLKVYKTDPADERTTTIHDSFPRIASGEETADPAVLEVIRHKSFGAWPSGDTELNLRKAWEVVHDGVRFAAYDFDSQPHVRLRMYVAHKAGLAKPEAVHIEMPDEAGWNRYLNLGRPAFAEQWNEELKLAGIDASAPIPDKLRANLARQMKFVREHPEVYVTFMARGTGLTRLTQNERHITQTRRRFMLLGQTLAGQQALDIRQCIAATRQLDLCRDAPLELWGYGHTASLVTVAALFENGIRKINLRDYPTTDKEQPDYLNISRFATPSQLLDLAKRRTQVKILKNAAANEFAPRCHRRRDRLDGRGGLSALGQARRQVFGIDSQPVPNTNSSYNGNTRVIRLTYQEHPDYVPLLKEAYRLWDEIEQETGTRLLHKTGVLYMGFPEGEAISGVKLASEKHALSYSTLTHAELAQQFPQFTLPEAMVGALEPEGGYLLSERAVETYARAAQQQGATLITNEPVLDWSHDAHGVTVQTASGTHTAARLIICAGRGPAHCCGYPSWNSPSPAKSSAGCARRMQRRSNAVSFRFGISTPTATATSQASTTASR